MVDGGLDCYDHPKYDDFHDVVLDKYTLLLGDS